MHNGVKAELGRACILEDYRKGVVLALLWKGIRYYIEKNGIQYLFGCSSVFTESKKEAISIFNFFKVNGFLHKNILVEPKKKYKFNKFEELSKNSNYNSLETTIKNIPDLLRAYLKFGAKICSYPAYDRDFKCMDFLTIIDYHNIKKDCMNIINRL
jgi:putative hemolysin